MELLVLLLFHSVPAVPSLPSSKFQHPYRKNYVFVRTCGILCISLHHCLMLGKSSNKSFISQIFHHFSFFRRSILPRFNHSRTSELVVSDLDIGIVKLGKKLTCFSREGGVDFDEDVAAWG